MSLADLKKEQNETDERMGYWSCIAHNGFQILDPTCAWMIHSGWNQYSQFYEDSLLHVLLSRIGARNKWCFEVGAADGVTFSCSKRLVDNGWSAVLIEGSDDEFEKLESIGPRPGVTCVKEMIGPDSLDRILEQAGAPKDIDVGILDIDGQEYWCWKGMQKYRPRIMLVEFAFDENMGQKMNFIPELGGEGQAGLAAITDLGKELGYFPIAKTACNILFVDGGKP